MLEATQAESGLTRDWLAAIVDGTTTPPISLQLDGEPSSAFFARAERSTTATAGDIVDTFVLNYRDPTNGFIVSLELLEWHDFSAVEWVLRLRQEGSSDSPLITDLQALDLHQPVSGRPVLYRSRGTSLRLDDFQYQAEPLGTIHSHHARVTWNAGSEGRSSVAWLPFWQLHSASGGVVVGFGWSGQWSASATRTQPEQVTLRAGLEQMRFRLHPGEAVRGPRVALLCHQGEVDRAQNLWRQFMLAHHIPQTDDGPVTAPLCLGTWGGTPTKGHLETIETVQREGLDYDYYWVDAGWYGVSKEPCDDVFTGSSWSTDVGDWRVNPYRHPETLKPVSEAAHVAGMKFLLWIEPERARHGAPITLEHPEWFLSNHNGERQSGETLLLDLGCDEARQWAIELIDGLITENGIDCYRQDFNLPPLGFWRHSDEPEREGLHELRHIEGLYLFWDELLRRHPGLLIDNCASGGRRIDLELMSRSLPLWRNDYNCFMTAEAEPIQVHGAGLSCWVPLHATSPVNANPGDTYQFRSTLSPGMVFSFVEFGLRTAGEDYPWDWHRQMMADYHRVRPFWYGEYHLLTSCTTAPDAWLAYQLHRTDLDAGVVVAFRRSESPITACAFPLKGLRGVAEYRFESATGEPAWVTVGEDLLRTGLPVAMPRRRDSRLLFYRAIP